MDLSKAVYYFRLSTEKQANADNAIAHYRDRGLRIGFKQEQIFFDVGSGGKSDRENYQHILNLAQTGQINAIYLPELSRLLRDVAEYKQVQTMLLSAKVRLFNLDGTEYRFEQPEDILQGDISMSFYEYERNRNKKKAIEGHQYLRDNNIPIRSVFPYVKVNNRLEKNHQLYGNSNTTIWDLANEIVDTFLATRSHWKTVEFMINKYGIVETKHPHLKFPTDATTLRRWLRQVYLRGNLKYKVTGEIHHKTHMPLLEGDRLKRVDTLLAIGKQGEKGKKPIRNMWKKITFCAECGAKMRCQVNSGKYQYVLCSGANPKMIKRKLNNPSKCTSKGSFGLNPDNLEQFAIEALQVVSTLIAATEYKPSTVVIPDGVVKLKNQIEQYETLAKEDADLVPVLEKKRQQLTDLLNSSPTLSEAEVLEQRANLVEMFSDSHYWEKKTNEDKSVIFHKYIERIDCFEGFPVFKFKDNLMSVEEDLSSVKQYNNEAWITSNKHLPESDRKQAILNQVARWREKSYCSWGLYYDGKPSEQALEATLEDVPNDNQWEEIDW